MKPDTPTFEELTTEQKHRTDPEYIAAVNAAIEVALEQVKNGEVLTDGEFWAEFDLDDEE